MLRFRFSLTALLGFVTFVAVSCAALKGATELWAMIVSGITLACLLFGVLASIYTDRATRAYWAGFAVVGWVYLVLQLIERRAENFTLPTLTLSYAIQGADLQAPEGSFYKYNEGVGIEQWLWSFLFAFIGGVVARQLYLRREQARQAQPAVGSQTPILFRRPEGFHESSTQAAQSGKAVAP